MEFVDIKLFKKNNLNFDVKENKMSHLLLETLDEKREFLQILNRVKKSSGSIYIEGEDILSCNKEDYKELMRKYSIVYSDYKFLEYKNVYENFKYYLEIRNYSKEEIEKLIDDVLKMFGMESKKNIELETATTVEKTMLGVARALASNPKYLIIDEIHIGLEEDIFEKLMNFFKEIRESGIGILYVTTDKKFKTDYEKHLGEAVGG